MVSDFKKFIMRGNVLDLSVGIIIGGAFSQIVNSLVKDIFTPVLSLLTNRVNFENIFISLDGNKYVTVAAASEAGASTINIGLFITAIINFLLMSCVVFLLVKLINVLSKRAEKLEKKDKNAENEAKTEAIPTRKKCPYCFTEVDINATRCPACTSELKDTINDFKNV